MRLRFYLRLLNYSLCGYDSAITIESITENDIQQININARAFLVASKGRDIPEKEKTALYASFWANPHEFEILLGDRILLKKIVEYTQKKIEEKGYGYFANFVAEQSAPINCDGIDKCTISNKYIFIDDTGKAKGKANTVCSTYTVANANAISQSSMPKCKPLPKHATQSEQTDDVTVLNDDFLCSSLRTKTIQTLKKKIGIVENLQFNRQQAAIFQHLESSPIAISREGESICALCSCICGARLKVTFNLSKKKGSGHWKPWNWDRHLLAHLQNRDEPNAVIQGKSATIETQEYKNYLNS